MPPHHLLPGLTFAVVLAAATVPALGGTLPRIAAASKVEPTTRPIGDIELAQARSESATADATLDALKLVATPGHLLDPLPANSPTSIHTLQTQYADLESKVAGYRATLGDEHPTLKAARAVLTGLRRQILDGVRRATVAAARDAVRAHDKVSRLEVPLSPKDAVGSIARVAAPALPLISPASMPSELLDAEWLDTAEPVSSGTLVQSYDEHPNMPLYAKLVAGLLLMTALCWALYQLFASRGRLLAIIRTEPAQPVEMTGTAACAASSSHLSLTDLKKELVPVSLGLSLSEASRPEIDLDDTKAEIDWSVVHASTTYQILARRFEREASPSPEMIRYEACQLATQMMQVDDQSVWIGLLAAAAKSAWRNAVIMNLAAMLDTSAGLRTILGLDLAGTPPALLVTVHEAKIWFGRLSTSGRRLDLSEFATLAFSSADTDGGLMLIFGPRDAVAQNLAAAA